MPIGLIAVDTWIYEMVFLFFAVTLLTPFTQKYNSSFKCSGFFHIVGEEYMKYFRFFEFFEWYNISLQKLQTCKEPILYFGVVIYDCNKFHRAFPLLYLFISIFTANITEFIRINIRTFITAVWSWNAWSIFSSRIRLSMNQVTHLWRAPVAGWGRRWTCFRTLIRHRYWGS